MFFFNKFSNKYFTNDSLNRETESILVNMNLFIETITLLHGYNIS